MNTVTRIVYLIICFAIPCQALDTKQHYYFDAQEKRYYCLNNSLNESTKRSLNQKIDSEVSWLKKYSVGNNLILLCTTICSIGFVKDVIRTFKEPRTDANRAKINNGILLTTLQASVALRAYFFRNLVKKKIAKLSLKQSLLRN